MQTLTVFPGPGRVPQKVSIESTAHYQVLRNGHHFLLIFQGCRHSINHLCCCCCCLVAKSCQTFLQPHGLQPTRLLCPWDSPGKNTGMGCHFLLQEIFQGLNPHLLHWQVSSLSLSHQAIPINLYLQFKYYSWKL